MTTTDNELDITLDTTATVAALDHFDALATELRRTTDPIKRARLVTAMAAHAKHTLIGAMNEERRLVVKALNRQGVSYSRIARELGISVSRVHQLIYGN